MSVTKLSPRFSATGQISVNDLAGIAAQGFKSIINNRPDGEGGPEQPLSDSLATVAAELGLVYLYVPVVSGSITQQNVEEFEKACENLEGPTLLFCRTGARSTMLLNMATVA